MSWTVFRTSFLSNKSALFKDRRTSVLRPPLSSCSLAHSFLPLSEVLLPLPHVDAAIQPVLTNVGVQPADDGFEFALLQWATCVLSMIPIGAIVYHLGLRSLSHLNKRRMEEPQKLRRKLVHGIDVSDSLYLNRPSVEAAIKFAEEAHKGQKRKTGEDYITHCIHTALILEDLLNDSLPEDRCEAAIICAVLHDVLDDTNTTKEEIEAHFGCKISDSVQKISNLSTMIQHLRRHRRQSLGSLTSIDDHEQSKEDSKLRTLILKTLDDPLILAVKLSDRLHNLRTLYALEHEKQRSVACETQKIFCTLAEHLGLLSLKAEMEDLCFCVLQPQLFLQVYHERELLWKKGKVFPQRTTSRRRKPIKAPSIHQQVLEIVSKKDTPSTKDLIQLVTPFTHVRYSNSDKINHSEDSTFALKLLQNYTKKILYEIGMGSFSAGLDITITGRLKSLYSTATKMKKKGIPIDEVYDLIGLKVVVADKGEQDLAQQVCYRILAAVQSVWKQIRTEFDDYIFSPKQSGYQSLHMALMDNKGIPFEVQIRTASMERDAEHGHASHWQYKEKSPAGDGGGELSIRDHIWGKGKQIIGRPVIRIKDGQCRDGVVVKTEQGGLEIIVATSNCKNMSSKYKSYTLALRSRYQKFQEQCEKRKWNSERGGDFFTSIERYVFCRDFAYHRIDNFGLRHPTTIVRPICVFDSEKDMKLHVERLESIKHSSVNSKVTEDELGMHDRVSHLKSMMGYCEAIAPTVEAGDVHVLLWPDAKIVRFPRGTTVADVVAFRDGKDAKLKQTSIIVNNQLVQPDTTLQDADVIVMQ